MSVRYAKANIDGFNVFYREAGDSHQPSILLLHGFPSSSHQYRNLIPLLSDDYHVVAPDLPGFGLTDQPTRTEFEYTFDNLSKVIDGFTEVIGLDKFAIYVFDYGAPIGFRLALKHPDRITAVISQNGNAYIEGIGKAFGPARRYWEDETPANRDALRDLLTPDFTLFQYEHGVSDTSKISPDSPNLDNHFLSRPGNDEIQLDLLYDYRTNVQLYGDFQTYLRDHQPPVLAVWGKNDPFFIPAGAEAYKRDVPSAIIRLIDSGHFPLETHLTDIATLIRDFLRVNIF